MFSNRTLAIAAVLALAVPTIGAAAPVLYNPVPEQLVEGHTVFAVLEVVDRTTTRVANFAAAVAVLVRERVDVDKAARFPGVLWFNDQYLVNPNSAERRAAELRYPCGGAVLAVNSGSPDPRVSMIHSTTAYNGATTTADSTVWPREKTARDTIDPYFTPTEPRFTPPPSNNPGDGYYSEFYAASGPYSNDNAWVGETGGSNIYTEATTANAGSYVESYLITDPNDHVWVIDLYSQYTRLVVGGSTSTSYASRVWVVNMLGSPRFIPDDGMVSCGPYVDIGTLHLPQPVGDVEVEGGVNLMPWQDNPRAGTGYREPSANGFCYNGNPNTGSSPCAVVPPTQPVRLYNALLYFRLEHLTVAGAARDHSVMTDPSQTNGCQTGTEWRCPGDNDNNEGFSHPFHPGVSGQPQREPCPTAFGGPNPTNHGGSTGAPYPCDYLHATRNIDLYWSGFGRPLEPPVRNFYVTDLEGSSAPYHDETGHP